MVAWGRWSLTKGSRSDKFHCITTRRNNGPQQTWIKQNISGWIQYWATGNLLTCVFSMIFTSRRDWRVRLTSLSSNSVSTRISLQEKENFNFCVRSRKLGLRYICFIDQVRMVVQESTSCKSWCAENILGLRISTNYSEWTSGADFFFNAVHFRRDLTCTLGLTNDLIDGDLASLYVDGV